MVRQLNMDEEEALTTNDDERRRLIPPPPAEEALSVATANNAPTAAVGEIRDSAECSALSP